MSDVRLTPTTINHRVVFTIPENDQEVWTDTAGIYRKTASVAVSYNIDDGELRTSLYAWRITRDHKPYKADRGPQVLLGKSTEYGPNPAIKAAAERWFVEYLMKPIIE